MDELRDFFQCCLLVMTHHFSLLSFILVLLHNVIPLSCAIALGNMSNDS